MSKPSYFLFARDLDTGHEVCWTIDARSTDQLIKDFDRAGGVDLPDPENVLPDADELTPEDFQPERTPAELARHYRTVGESLYARAERQQHRAGWRAVEDFDKATAYFAAAEAMFLIVANQQQADEPVEVDGIRMIPKVTLTAAEQAVEDARHDADGRIDLFGRKIVPGRRYL